MWSSTFSEICLNTSLADIALLADITKRKSEIDIKIPILKKSDPIFYDPICRPGVIKIGSIIDFRLLIFYFFYLVQHNISFIGDNLETSQIPRTLRI